MMYFTVYVEDRLTSERVVLLDLATRTEAAEIVEFLKAKCDSCNIYYVRFDINKEEGMH